MIGRVGDAMSWTGTAVSRRGLVALAFALAPLAGGCGGAEDAGVGPGTGDGGAGVDCGVGILFSPSAPVAGPTSEVRAIAVVGNADGVRTYAWRVSNAAGLVTHAEAQPDGSQITFPAPTPGVYDVALQVDVLGQYCPEARQSINVLDSDANLLDVRLQVVPPPDVGAPPIVRRLGIPGGGDYQLGPVVLDPGRVVTAAVTSGGAGVPAYLQLRPLGMADAVVEAYAGASGAFSARLLDQPHEVLVIPTSPALAPRRLPTWTPGQPIAITAGAAISGVVRDPAGNPLGDAKVQLTIDGVPSTLATTQPDGTFTVRGSATPGTALPTVVAITPPAGSGLPRLEAYGTFDLGGPITAAYGSSLVLRDLGGVQVRRAGVAVPGAQVTVVGALAAAGTVTVGASAPTLATGYVRIATAANGSGVLPATLAPAAPLSAVVSVAPGDLAVSALELTAAVPQTLDAPPMAAIATAATRELVALDHARLELIPSGALALAGAQPIRIDADAAGVIASTIPAGGTFDARWSDPAGRAGTAIVADVTAASLQAAHELPPALRVSGVLSVTGSANSVVGASVQILCDGCTGLDRDRPLAEVASDLFGGFELAVPDPGAGSGM